MHFGWLFCHCLVLTFHPLKSIFFFLINPFILHEKPAWWIISKALLTPTNYISSTTEPNIFLSVYIHCCSAAYLTVKLFWHFTLHAFFSSSLFIITMLISDIRMKSRGVSMPNSQSAASRLAQHTDQHPGITQLITISTLSSLIVMTPAITVNVCLVNFDRITCIKVYIVFFFVRVVEP